MYGINKIVLALVILNFSSCSKSDEGLQTEKLFEIKGADISFLPKVRQSGISMYNQNYQEEDMLQTLKNAGVNTVRLRLWKNPAEDVSSFTSVKKLASECRLLGLKVLLTVHFSDTWADPSKQAKPSQWQDYSFNVLMDTVYAYIEKVMEEISPDYIQIGNEINNGFLWPEGSISNLPQMKSLLNKAIQAVREANSTTKIIIHYAGFTNAYSFYSSIADVDYDIIGLSYYPMWHGKDLSLLAQGMNSLSANFDKWILIVETSYPFTLGWNDWTNNVVGLENQLLSEYPASPDGQKNYFKKIIDITREIHKSIGFCYWGGECVSYNGATATNGSSWENQAFWDFNNRALPIISLY